MKFLIIGLGGFIGAILRYSISGWFQKAFGNSSLAFFPFGTLAVNLIGCFFLGFFSLLLVERQIDPQYRFLINVGFLGAFTTFSTFSVESLSLIEDQEFFWAFMNIFISCSLGLLTAWGGRVLYRVLWS